jgi:hypothetical protein
MLIEGRSQASRKALTDRSDHVSAILQHSLQLQLLADLKPKYRI